MANIAGIMELYTAYFNRAADKNGVDYWANEMDNNGWTLDDVANTFAQQPEYTRLYDGKTNQEIVDLVYTNVLNKNADTDAAGAEYWLAELDSGAVTVSQFILAVVNSATEMVDGVYKHPTDAAIVNNKTAVSQYAYDTNSNATDISLAGVTEDEASTQSAKNQIDAENPANIGETFTLTASAAGEILVGTTKNDTFSGDKDSIDAADKLVDGSTTDNDTANLTFNGDLPKLTIANVENVNVTISNTAPADVSAANFSGVKTLTVTKSDLMVGGSTIAGNKTLTVADVNADNVAKVVVGSATTDATVNQKIKAGATIDANNASGNVTVLGAATVTATGAGTGDKVTVTAFANTDATVLPAGDAAKALVENKKAVSVTTNAATVDVKDSGANKFTGAITVDAAAATSVTIANAEGGATVTATRNSDTTANTIITVNNIDDTGATITAGTGTKTNNVIINLDGTSETTDAATITAAGFVTFDASVSTTDTVDKLTLSGNGAAATYTQANADAGVPTTIFTLAGDQDVTLSTTTAALNKATVTDATTAGTTKVSLTTVASADLSKVASDSIELAGTAALAGQTLEVATGTNISLAKDQSNGIAFAGKVADSVINVVVADDTAADGSTIELEVAAFDAATNVKTLNIDATVGKFTATSTTVGTAGTIVVTGTKDVKLGNTTAKAVDASASTGAITIDTNNAALTTITTGTGKDDVTVDQAAVYTVDTGAGDDKLTIGTTVVAASAFVTGLGNDTIAVNNAASFVISAGEGDDKVTIDNNIDSDSILVGGAGSDQLIFAHTNGNNFSSVIGGAGDVANPNFSFTGFEILDISALTTGKTIKIDNTDLNAQTFTLKGSSIVASQLLTVVGTANADVIDASNITVTDASVVLDGGAGNDTITGTASADTIDGGAGSDSINGGAGLDTVTYADLANYSDTGTQTGIIVNLSSSAIANTTVLGQLGTSAGYTADSIISIAANTAVYAYGAADTAKTNSAAIDTLSSIENVIGTDGADYIVGSTAANVINGGDGADYIYAGLGADTITGGAGNDTIVLTETSSAVDTVIFEATAALNGSDTITGFVLANDKINLDALTAETALTGNLTTGTTAITIAQGNVFLVTTVTSGDADTAAAAATAINATATWTESAGVKAYFVIADDNSSAIYEYTYSDVTTEIQGTELTLMGTVDKALTATEIVFA